MLHRKIHFTRADIRESVLDEDYLCRAVDIINEAFDEEKSKFYSIIEIRELYDEHHTETNRSYYSHFFNDYIRPFHCKYFKDLTKEGYATLLSDTIHFLIGCTKDRTQFDFKIEAWEE